MVSLAISSPCSIRRETLRRNCSEASVAFSRAASKGYFFDMKCSACLRVEVRTLIGPMVISFRPWFLIATSIHRYPYLVEPISLLPVSSSVRAIPDNSAGTSVPRLHRMSRDLANLPQFLVGVIHLFFISRAFQVAQSRFFRNAAQFSFRYAEQEGGSGLGHEFWYLIRQIVHGLPTICTPASASLMTAGSTVYLCSVLRGKPFFHQL